MAESVAETFLFMLRYKSIHKDDNNITAVGFACFLDFAISKQLVSLNISTYWNMMLDFNFIGSRGAKILSKAEMPCLR